VKKALHRTDCREPEQWWKLHGALRSGWRLPHRNIVPGRYRLFVERTGYQAIDKQHRRSEGRDAHIELWPGVEGSRHSSPIRAVVEGRVTDEDGDPMPEAQVAVLPPDFRFRTQSLGAGWSRAHQRSRRIPHRGPRCRKLFCFGHAARPTSEA